MYINVEQYGDKLYISNLENNEVKYNIDSSFEPSFFIKDEFGDYNIFNSNDNAIEIKCKMIDYFDKIKKEKSIYGYSHPKFQYIYKKFYNHIRPDLSNIRIHHLDIETEIVGNEINVINTEGEIRLIQVIETDTKKIIVFGLKDKTKNDNYYLDSNLGDGFKLHYYKMRNEVELIQAYIELVKKRKPIITDAWGGNNFDFQYIINRCKKLNIDYLNLSPFKKFKERKINIFGTFVNVLFPIGANWIDAKEVYEFFSNKNLDSHKISNVAKVELNTDKTDISEYNSLNDLYENNFDLYLKYGTKDVLIMYNLNKKLLFNNIMINQAWDMGVNFEDIFSTIKPGNQKIYNELMNEKIVINKKEYSDMNQKQKYSGGYIELESYGRFNGVVGFDIKSGYPNSIRKNNISPETLLSIDDIKKRNNAKFLMDLRNNLKKYNMESYLLNLSVEKYKKIISILKDENLILAPNGEYYKKEIEGKFPKIIEKIFNEREENIKLSNYFSHKKNIIEAEIKFRLEEGKRKENVN